MKIQSSLVLVLSYVIIYKCEKVITAERQFNNCMGVGVVTAAAALSIIP
jgi:hypothetical protein